MFELLLRRFQEDPTFRRLQDTTHPRIIESYCRACGALAGASPRLEVLAIAESAHLCRALEAGRFRPRGVRQNPSH